MTGLSVKDAFIATASLFEKEPKRYVWSHASVPPEDALQKGATGCILAWVGFFVGGQPETATSAMVALRVLQINEIDFYFRMLWLVPDPKRGLWSDDARAVANGIRAYAEKYL